MKGETQPTSETAKENITTLILQERIQQLEAQLIESRQCEQAALQRANKAEATIERLREVVSGIKAHRDKFEAALEPSEEAQAVEIEQGYEKSQAKDEEVGNQVEQQELSDLNDSELSIPESFFSKITAEEFKSEEERSCNRVQNGEWLLITSYGKPNVCFIPFNHAFSNSSEVAVKSLMRKPGSFYAEAKQGGTLIITRGEEFVGVLAPVPPLAPANRDLSEAQKKILFFYKSKKPIK